MIQTILKFYRFAKAHKKEFRTDFIASILNYVFEALQVSALAIVLQAMVAGTMRMSTALTVFIIMLVSVTGIVVCSYFTRKNQTIGSFLTCAEKRTEMGERMKYMPMGYFNTHSLGNITAAVTNSMEEIQSVAPRVMDKVVHGTIHAIVISIMLTIFDWRIGCIIFAGILLYLGVNALMQRRSHKVSPKRSAAQTAIVGAVLEYVQGIAVVRAFNLAGEANQRIDKAIAECEKQNVAMELAFIPFVFLQNLLLRCISVLVAFSALLFTLAGTMELSVCMLMMVCAFMVYSQLESAGNMSSMLRSIDLAIDKADEINTIPVIDEKSAGAVPAGHTLTLENISFSYEKRKIINGVSLTIPAGSSTAIVGPSGSGKTTLCNLITRFWDVDAGRILLGGHDIKDYTYDELMRNFSMVFQNVYLFNDTIGNNIRFGKSDAAQEEVEAAAKKACCHDFIASLPDGYDTIIGEGGASISGGEKQRISIARAILKDAPIIILDEATANIDPENESALQQAISELTASKTVIMIAHRLKTIRDADQIIVLDAGAVVQKGTHDELMQQGGLYKELVSVREKAIGWKLGRSKAASAGLAG